jgi:hypothetical protein
MNAKSKSFIGEKNMKNKKWLNYTLGVLITLIVLTAVAGAGFRAGMMQNPPMARVMNGTRPSLAHDNLGRLPQQAQDDFRDDKLQGMQGDLQRQAPRDGRGLDFRDDGFRFPIFGLIQLAVLGLLVWVGYKLIKKSGWRLSLNKAAAAPAPAAETPHPLK